MAAPLMILAIAACGGDDSDEAGTDAAAQPDVAEQSGGDALELGSASAEATADATASAGPVDFGAIGRDVIVEMHVVLSSDDIQRSVAAISADASALGGGIASSDIDYGDALAGTAGHAVLVVKVPPESVDRLLDGLDTTAAVLSIDQSAQDVTEQLVDLDVRIANARQSVDNVRGFMAATTNLSELVTLESELTRRQTELEQLEAQQRNLSERVALSTITIEVIPTAAVPAPPLPAEDRGLSDALADGWTAFTAVVFGVVYVIAVLAPFLAVAAIAALILIPVVRRTRRRNRPVTPPVSSEPNNGVNELPDPPVGAGSTTRHE